MKIKSLVSLTLLCVSVPAFASLADATSWLKGFEITGAGGYNWSSADNTSLVVSDRETDNVMVNDVTRGKIWKIGFGYHFFDNYFKQRSFLNDLLIELNVYHNSETIQGVVWQYQDPAFQNYSFQAPVATTRAMLDVKPGLLTRFKTTLYPIVGVGAAWSDVSYLEEVTNGATDPDSYHSLGTHTNVNVVYDLGAGLRYEFNPHWSLALEYIYTYLINVTPASEATTSAALQSPPEFTVYNQNLMLALNFTV